MMPGTYHKYSSVPGQDTNEDLDEISLHSPRSESSESNKGDKEKGLCDHKQTPKS